ncbi:MAG: hypothetical protein K2X63_02610 [Burkholderiaceae bacterium]|nr:hypothetical protein [Burkholderiaceae bacterium]
MKYDTRKQVAEQQARNIERHRADHLAGLAPSKLKPLDWGAELGIRREDIAVFLAAAQAFDHIIAVRATNTKSLPYIGQKMFTPKPIDCKPKTADVNVYVSEIKSQVKCAGLVVDPTIVGHKAFTGKKSNSVWEAWSDFLNGRTEKEKLTKVFRRIDTKGFYAVDTDEQSKYYGCLMLSNQDIPADDFNLAKVDWQSFKLQHMFYIHGDYDLYGLLDIAKIEKVMDPGNLGKVRPELIRGKLHGMPHIYTLQFPDIQKFLNMGIEPRIEMVQHDGQANVAHKADEIYVFYPNGGKYRIDATVADIEAIYERMYKQEVRG